MNDLRDACDATPAVQSSYVSAKMKLCLASPWVLRLLQSSSAPESGNVELSSRRTHYISDSSWQDKQMYNEGQRVAKLRSAYAFQHVHKNDSTPN